MTIAAAHFDPETWPEGWDNPPGAPPSQRRVPDTSRGDRIRSFTYRRSELESIPPPSYLIDGILNNNVLALLSGKFGTYKSFISVSWACSVATGVPWLGHEVATPGPVVYIAAEGASGLRARVEAWECSYNRGQRVPDNRLIVVGCAVNLRSGGDIEAVDALCAEVRPRMLIWDTLHRCAPGVEENSNTEMGLVVQTLDGLRERHGCAQLVNHHTGHAGVRSRGASSIEDDFENSWVVKLGGDNEDRSIRNPRTMEHRKVKDGELSEPIAVKLALAQESATIERSEQTADWLIESKVKAKAAECDAAGIPSQYGRDRLMAAALRAGIEGVSTALWGRVAQFRKAS